MELRDKKERPADPRPYIGDSGRAVEGALAIVKDGWFNRSCLPQAKPM